MSPVAVDPFTLWHPVASEYDVPYRHVHHGQLLGRELAVWRADDDFVNVWENRCLHRGVRLSIGSNDGTELRCQYHGWRYANRSAGCTYIPAHPADAPARTICNRTFPSVERYGLVWSGESAVGEPPTVDVLEAGTPFGLRNLPVHAPAELVRAAFAGPSFPAVRESGRRVGRDVGGVGRRVLGRRSPPQSAARRQARRPVRRLTPRQAQRPVRRLTRRQARRPVRRLTPRQAQRQACHRPPCSSCSRWTRGAA